MHDFFALWFFRYGNFFEGMTKGLYSISCSTRHGLSFAQICFNFDGYGAEIGLLEVSIYPQRSPLRGSAAPKG